MIFLTIFVIYKVYSSFKKSEPSIILNPLSKKEKADLVLEFEQEIKNKDPKTHPEDFRKFYKIDPDQKRGERNNYLSCTGKACTICQETPGFINCSHMNIY